MLRGPLQITIPPDRSLVSPIRLAASGMATGAGCSLDEIDDIKLVTGEVLLVLIEQGCGNPLSITMAQCRDAFTMRARTETSGFDEHRPELELCRTVLDQLCRIHSVELVAGDLRIRADYAVQSGASSEGRDRVR